MKSFVFMVFFFSQASFATQPIIADFFNAPKIKSAQLNPTGDKILLKLRHKNNYLLMLYHLKTKQKNVLFYEPKKTEHENEIIDNIIKAKWLSDSEILTQLLLDDGSYTDYLITVKQDNNGKKENSFEKLSFSGHLIRPSQYQKRKLIVAQLNRHWGTDLYYVNIDSKDKTKRLNGDLRQATNWLLDAQDNVKLGWGFVEKEFTVWYRQTMDDDWEIIRKSKDKNETFLPVLVSDKNKPILVLHNHNRDEIALQEFDPVTKKFGKIIFEKEGIDIKGITLNSDYNALASARYFENGVLRNHYFNEKAESSNNALKEIFPNQQAIVISENVSKEQQIILTFNHENRGKYFHLNTNKNKATLIGSNTPDFKTSNSRSRIIHHKIPTSDGFHIESYLTMPNNVENPPLIVMPHGGPIGVQDTIYFDPHSQLLASMGYATLKVNYRGSSGYGKKFMFAGQKQWGLNIENDINNALENIIKLDIIDQSRMCIFGSSYGGYSALMSVIKYPNKFKCAISFAGVTDIPLMFAEDTRMKNDGYKQAMKDIVGDPIKDKDYQRNNSPVYRYKELLTPILLVHGTDDPLVSYEHSERLSLLLTKKKIEHEFMLLDGVGHGFDSGHSATIFYNKVFSFLDKYLLKNKVLAKN